MHARLRRCSVAGCCTETARLLQQTLAGLPTRLPNQVPTPAGSLSPARSPAAAPALSPLPTTRYCLITSRLSSSLGMNTWGRGNRIRTQRQLGIRGGAASASNQRGAAAPLRLRLARRAAAGAACARPAWRQLKAQQVTATVQRNAPSRRTLSSHPLSPHLVGVGHDLLRKPLDALVEGGGEQQDLLGVGGAAESSRVEINGERQHLRAGRTLRNLLQPLHLPLPHPCPTPPCRPPVCAGWRPAAA